MKKDSGDTTQLLSLSLFVLILAFFIILNTISDFREEKTLPVLASLESAFASKIIGGSGSPSTSVSENEVFTSSGIIDELDSYFKAGFDIFETTRGANNSVLKVKMRYQDLVSVLSRPDTMGGQDLLKNLRSIFYGGGTNYMLNIVFQSADPLKANTAKYETVFKQIQTVGFYQDDLKISLVKGDPKFVELLFYPAGRGVLYKAEEELNR